MVCARRFVPLLSLGAAVGAFELASGFIYPAVALNLEARGATPALIGAQAATVAAGLVLSALAVPWLIGRLGAIRLGLVNVAATSVTVLGFGLIDAMAWWFALGLAIGVSGNIWYVQAEVWLNQLADDRCRGRIVGLYSMAMEGLFAAGPLLILVIGSSGKLPFALLAIVVALASIPLAGLRRHVTQPVRPSFRDMVEVGTDIPLVLVAVAVCGYFEGAILPLWPIYAVAQGLPQDLAATTLTLIVLGHVTLQLVVGWAADRLPRRLVLAGCALGACLGAAGLPWVDLTSWLAWPYLMLWGGLGFGVYTVSLVLIGQHLAGSRLVVATAALGLAWAAGALIGSATTGQSMELFGAAGLPVSIALAYAFLAAIALNLPIVRRPTTSMAPMLVRQSA